MGTLPGLCCFSFFSSRVTRFVTSLTIVEHASATCDGRWVTCTETPAVRVNWVTRASMPSICLAAC
ncbi:hypothetical protein [Microbispora sp. GKU 823]|uniref:hypothetical protein n=1 Tax=Microbispora sp. GKU 823 TaxID=1652100 RepID=UPI0011812FF5|nr:hypothetical protein [Microbispora sp. GKU 823]